MDSGRKSVVWDHFSAVSDTLVKCTQCESEIKTKNGSTTNLWTHLKCRHQQLHASLEKEKGRKAKR
jgi:hypothetical protein